MVCTEYPPMQGGVGRYTHNLVKSLHSNGLEVIVVSGSDGSGEYKGISPYNFNNSEHKLSISITKHDTPYSKTTGLVGYVLGHQTHSILCQIK